MATTSVEPKRASVSVAQTATFKGKDQREAAKKALEAISKPVAVDGQDFEAAVCSQNIDGVDFLRAYWRPVTNKVDALLSLMQADPIGVANDFDYGRGLYWNSLVREAINVENSGPAEIAKTFEKSVQAFMKSRAAAGKPVSEEKAREIVKMMQEIE